MGDPLRDAARDRPDAAALDDGERVWTYAELDAAVGRMARRLAPLGAGPGATVALLAHPSALAIQALYAVPRTGAVLAPLNPGLGGAALERALDALGPGLLLSTTADVPGLELDPDWLTTVDDLAKPPPGSGPVDDVGVDPASTAGIGTGSSMEPAGLESPWAILWTSGTSGEPRAVPVTSAALDHSASATASRLGLRAEDRWYASLSLAHIGGLALVHRAARVGCALVVRGRFSVETLAALIDEDGLTHASLVPTMLHRLVELRVERPPPSSLRCLLVGGAAAADRLVQAGLDAGYPVALTYGMTETCSQVATAPPGLVAAKSGTVGAPLEGLEIDVREHGEIWVRGPTVAPSLADDQGWLATGDLGRLDVDGHLWITGRLGERIISGGVNVDPHAVEKALCAIPGVSAVAVVGLPDDVWGERVAALVVLAAESVLDAEALTEAARERLSGAELPRMIEIGGELPRNPNGKVDRGAVRILLGGGA